jgi:negative regulator of sigma E activity
MTVNVMDLKYSETLSAFFDGEQVDGELLAESLAQPGAHTLLLEYAALRAKSQSGARPSPEFLDAVAAKMRQAAHRRRWQFRFAVVAASACLALVAVAVGFIWAPVVARPVTPPSPATAQRLAPLAAPREAPSDLSMSPTAAPRRQATAAKPPSLDRPPVAALRLRLGQWEESLAHAGGEGRRD